MRRSVRKLDFCTSSWPCFQDLETLALEGRIGPSYWQFHKWRCTYTCMWWKGHQILQDRFLVQHQHLPTPIGSYSFQRFFKEKVWQAMRGDICQYWRIVSEPEFQSSSAHILFSCYVFTSNGLLGCAGRFTTKAGDVWQCWMVVQPSPYRSSRLRQCSVSFLCS